MLKQKSLLLVVLITLLVVAACAPAQTPEPTVAPTSPPPPTEVPTAVPPPPTEIPTEVVAPTEEPTTVSPTDAPPAGLSADQLAQAASLINTNCTVCHSADRIRAAEKDMAGWSSTVNRMIGKGAKLSPDEATLVIQFLSDGNEP
jgi:cytochrome c5